MIVLLDSQLAVQLTTVATFILTIGLAWVMTSKYARRPSRALMFWSLGIWLFALGVLIEIVFAFGYYSELLIGTYLFIVALLVESLALGSVQLVKSGMVRRSYYTICALFTVLLLYSLMTENLGMILYNYVVWGNIPTYVAIWSGLITFPAAVVLLGVAIKSYLNKRSRKMLSIIAGVVIVSIAGTLYIAQYPAFLYLSEFIGIVLLWYGFI